MLLTIQVGKCLKLKLAAWVRFHPFLLKTVHGSVYLVLKPLVLQSLRGITEHSVQKCKYRLHFLLSSFIFDMPEAEDSFRMSKG